MDWSRIPWLTVPNALSGALMRSMFVEGVVNVVVNHGRCRSEAMVMIDRQSVGGRTGLPSEYVFP